MAFSALLGAATAAKNAAKNTALHIKDQLRKKKYVGDLHIDAVTQHSTVKAVSLCMVPRSVVSSREGN